MKKFSLSEYRKEVARDLILHLVIIITVICVTGIVICWKYGVEIDQFCKNFW